MAVDFARPELYINRELSWLEFNRRVLEEAQDKTQPLLERVKFTAIFSSNLDEFFEIRVAGIKQQIQNETSDRGPDGMSAAQVFREIHRLVHQLVAQQHKTWAEDLVPLLAEQGIRLLDPVAFKAKERMWAKKYFFEEVFPVLTPLAVDQSHPFPQVQNRSQNLIVQVRKPGRRGESFHAIVQLPRVLPPMIQLPRERTEQAPYEYILLKDLIKLYVAELFPGLRVEGAYGFRITRNGDLYIDDEEAENLLSTIEKELRRRNKGNAVRLELEAACPPELELFLLGNLNLEAADLNKVPGPLSFQDLMPLAASDTWPALKDRPFAPAFDLDLPPDADAFDVLRKEDILLHHPYESFEAVVDWLRDASDDPHVLAIKMTLYRTSGDSPIVKALINAANNGKQVTALVELKARFDEANNIQWAKLLEDAGVHVVYGVVGLKVHCKLCMVVRRDPDRIRRYVHLGTGNYHPRTARIYTDLSLLTSAEELSNEVAMLFNALTGLGDYPEFTKLIVAPYDIGRRLNQLIDGEIALAKAGKPARIIFKINSIVDQALIAKLYEASCAGVKVDLIVRGICCLRPGLKGVSENIRVISIVGRFLEHSRIFFFGNGGQSFFLLGSADLMPRNLYRRVEVLFPVDSPQLKLQLEEEILPAYLNDRIKARELQSDGSYVRLKPLSGQKPFQAQLFFRERAREQISIAAMRHSAENRRFQPLKNPSA